MHHGAAAPAYTQSDMFCSGSGSGGGFSLSVIIQELTVTYFSKGPALLPFSSFPHCLSLSDLPALFLILCFRHFFLPCSSTCLHCILLLVVIFVFLLFLLSATVAPCLAEFNSQTRFCSFLLCRASTQSQPPPFSFRCHTLPVFSSSSFFRLSSPCHVCLSASALTDLSVGGLQHVSALASVTRDDLHLIRGSR